MAGQETLLRLTNLSVTEVHWDLAWPGSKLSLSPGSGLLAARGEAVLCVRAVRGAAGWRGQVQVYTDNNLINIEVVISGTFPSQYFCSVTISIFQETNRRLPGQSPASC